MLGFLKANRIKLIGAMMVLATLGLAGTSASDSVPPECFPNCPPCTGGCMFWEGGPVCVPEGWQQCYFGARMQCVCNASGVCNMTWIGSCW